MGIAIVILSIIIILLWIANFIIFMTLSYLSNKLDRLYDFFIIFAKEYVKYTEGHNHEN